MIVVDLSFNLLVLTFSVFLFFSFLLPSFLSFSLSSFVFLFSCFLFCFLSLSFFSFLFLSFLCSCHLHPVQYMCSSQILCFPVIEFWFLWSHQFLLMFPDHFVLLWILILGSSFDLFYRAFLTMKWGTFSCFFTSSNFYYAVNIVSYIL